MKQSEIEQHIITLNRETGELCQKVNDVYKIMQIMITLNTATLILVISHILKIV